MPESRTWYFGRHFYIIRHAGSLPNGLHIRAGRWVVIVSFEGDDELLRVFHERKHVQA